MVSYHTCLLNYELGLVHLQGVDPFSPTTCEFLAELIEQDTLLARSLCKMLTGKSEYYSLNNLCLSQLFCTQVVQQMQLICESDANDVENKKHLFIELVKMMAFCTDYLDWKDLAFVEQLKLTVQSTLKDCSIEHLYTAMLDYDHTDLLKVVDDSEVDCIIQELKLSDSMNFEVAMAETVVRLLNSGEEDHWKVLFLLCLHYKVHFLEVIVVC